MTKTEEMLERMYADEVSQYLADNGYIVSTTEVKCVSRIAFNQWFVELKDNTTLYVSYQLYEEDTEE